jgi:hypothetical protein
MSLDAATLLEYGLEATANSYHLACCGVQGPLTMREWRLIQALLHIARGTRSVSWMRAEAEQALVQWQATVEGGTAQQTAGVPGVS